MPVKAGDFDDKPYLLRALLGLDRSSNYATTSGRQASIAYPAGSSANPAADDFALREQTGRAGRAHTAHSYRIDGWLDAVCAG